MRVPERYTSPVPRKRDFGPVRNDPESPFDRTVESDLANSVSAVAVAALRGDPDAGTVAVRDLLATLRAVAPGIGEVVRRSVAAIGTAGLATRTATMPPMFADRTYPSPTYASPNPPIPLDGVPDHVAITSGFESIEPILAPAARAMLTEICEEHRRADVLRAAGVHPRRTLILTGPPGVGKTTTARWIAREMGLPLAEANIASIVSSFLGRTAQNLHDVFEFARRTPVVLFLDEFDAISKQREDAQDVGEMKRAVSGLLMELDRAPERGLLIAATNHPQLIDRAILRRFECDVFLDLPDAESAVAILETHLGVKCPDSLRLTVGSIMRGHSGSKIRLLADAVRRRIALDPSRSLSHELLVGLASQCDDKSTRRLLARTLSSRYSTSEIAELFGVAKSTAHSYITGKQ